MIRAMEKIKLREYSERNTNNIDNTMKFLRDGIKANGYPIRIRRKGYTEFTMYYICKDGREIKIFSTYYLYVFNDFVTRYAKNITIAATKMNEACFNDIDLNFKFMQGLLNSYLSLIESNGRKEKYDREDVKVELSRGVIVVQ